MLVTKAKKISLNANNKAKGQVGPIIFEKQAEVISKQLEDAKNKGGIIHCGGVIENYNGGVWCLPTVVSNVNHSMDLMMEETFGPIIPVMSFKTEEEALHLANDTIFGLSASLFSSDELAVDRLAFQLEAGAININDGSLTSRIYDVEKNAFKQSGLNGSRMGDAGLMRFFRKRALLIQTSKPLAVSYTHLTLPTTPYV